ncbi:hypothetical protein F442_15464 [Phytophthora nicotianae P10297]|uniref:Uncharacterized protein n=2 Tax=Phytophthora nicotianae TaxID=4792 RepID=W2YR41_PHYNI|nr:hypothetical protein F442_15464 [Phytophthora nicotianae P10297]
MLLNPFLSFGSVLEASAVLNELLVPAGYRRDKIEDIAIWEFLDHERASIEAPTKIHLLAAKKALLYAIPVIAPPKVHRGIGLTSTVTSPAIWFDDGNVGTAGLAQGDKFRLIGFAFPPRLVNHLSTDVFPWKYFYKLPAGYTGGSVDISRLEGVTAHSGTRLGSVFLIKATHYEKVETFNAVNRVIAGNLYPPVLAPLMELAYASLSRAATALRPLALSACRLSPHTPSYPCSTPYFRARWTIDQAVWVRLRANQRAVAAPRLREGADDEGSAKCPQQSPPHNCFCSVLTMLTAAEIAQVETAQAQTNEMLQLMNNNGRQMIAALNAIIAGSTSHEVMSEQDWIGFLALSDEVEAIIAGAKDGLRQTQLTVGAEEKRERMTNVLLQHVLAMTKMQKILNMHAV